MKPIIKWSGGKAREIKHFKKHYPERFNLFIEPFVGGGAVFFDLNFETNVIADVHDDLINFYQQIKNGHGPKMFKMMGLLGRSEKTYYYIRDNFVPADDIERALRFYYLRKTCFRGMLRYNKNGKFNIPFDKHTKAAINFDDLKDKGYNKLLSNTEICKATFSDVFEKYNDKNTFVFLDPPYDSTFTDYGYCQFTKEHHEELSKLFKATQNKCLLVIGKTDFVVDLYKDYIIEFYHKKYSFKIYAGRVGKEIDNSHLIIKNY